MDKEYESKLSLYVRNISAIADTNMNIDGVEGSVILSDAADYIKELESKVASGISASTKANHLRIKELEEQKAELLDFVKGLHSMNLAQILDKSVELYGKLK